MNKGTIVGMESSNGVSKKGKPWVRSVFVLKGDDTTEIRTSTFDTKFAKDFSLGDYVQYTYETDEKPDGKRYHNLTMMMKAELSTEPDMTEQGKPIQEKLDEVKELGLIDAQLESDSLSPEQREANTLLFNICWQKAIDLHLFQVKHTSPVLSIRMEDIERVKTLCRKLMKGASQARYELLGR